MRSRSNRLAQAAACLVAACACIAGNAGAQSLSSLSDRVAALEARAQTEPGQTLQSVDLLNRIAQLEADVKDLRGQVEQMRHDSDQAGQRAKAQYDDLDARLARIENAAASTPATPATARSSAAPSQPAVARAPAPVAPATAAATQPADASTTAPTDDQGAYKAALAALTAEQYVDSAQRFAAFVQQYPDSPLVPNAWYWMGESYYVTQNYALALKAFQTVVDRYPNSNKMPDALLKVGFSQDGLRQRDAAEATLRAVIARYPDSEAANRARSRLRAMSLDTGH